MTVAVSVGNGADEAGRRTILIAGGAGFIGAHFATLCAASGRYRVVVLDKLTYAAEPLALAPWSADPECMRLCVGDIADRQLVDDLLAEERPAWIINLAAESHVDRGIDGPAPFLQANVAGTFHLLEAARVYWQRQFAGDPHVFRFLQVSTDEVFGPVEREDGELSLRGFDEQAPYRPRNPYAASKAAADLFVQSYHCTYGLPVLISRAANNYGPWQYPEKLIPVMIQRALQGEPLPIYGDGLQRRQWIHVADHCTGLLRVLEAGQIGQSYNLTSGDELTNLQLVELLLAGLKQRGAIEPGQVNVEHVVDRPGHDRCYRIDAGRAQRDLGWSQSIDLAAGISQTIEWYLQHRDWVEGKLACEGGYRRRGLIRPPRSICSQPSDQELTD